MTPMTHTLMMVFCWLPLVAIGVYEVVRQPRELWGWGILSVSVVFAGGIIWQ